MEEILDVLTQAALGVDNVEGGPGAESLWFYLASAQEKCTKNSIENKVKTPFKKVHSCWTEKKSVQQHRPSRKFVWVLGRKIKFSLTILNVATLPHAGLGFKFTHTKIVE